MDEKHYDIFISYSRKDKYFVNIIVQILKKEGYTVWIDTQDINFGEQYKVEIVKAIRNSSVVIYFSSVNSNASDLTANEIGIATKMKKTIIPVRLDNADYRDSISFDLVNTNYIDADPNDINEKLIKSLRSQINYGIDYEKESKLSSQSVKLLYNWRLQFIHIMQNFSWRHRFVNFVMIAISYLSGILFCICSYLSIKALSPSGIKPLDDPEWTLKDYYGYGFLAYSLINIFVYIGNMYLFMNKDKGLWVMASLSLFAIIPFYFINIKSYYILSIIEFVSFLMYWIILHIKSHKRSAWKLMIKENKSWKACVQIAWSLNIIVLLIIPFFLACSFEVNNNKFSNGKLIIEARLNHNYDSILKLANKMAKKEDGFSDKYAGAWYGTYIVYMEKTNHTLPSYALAYYTKHLFQISDYNKAEDYFIKGCNVMIDNVGTEGFKILSQLYNDEFEILDYSSRIAYETIFDSIMKDNIDLLHEVCNDYPRCDDLYKSLSGI